jgi:hypothetical protein
MDQVAFQRVHLNRRRNQVDKLTAREQIDLPILTQDPQRRQKANKIAQGARENNQ